MSAVVQNKSEAPYRAPLLLWVLTAIAIVCVLLVAREGFSRVVDAWFKRPEYSHGVLIPAISLFLVWQRRSWLSVNEFSGSWAGLLITLAGLAVWLMGSLSSIFTISQYALVVMLYGITLSLVGWQVFRRLWVPLLMLLFMIPLPNFLYFNLSSELQLISSSIGVWFIRLFGVSVHLSGNVIDLGHFQMQVVEACDGLRYLFPLMTLGFIVAYFFRAPIWQRLAVFVSSVPLTIIMNSVRIGMIGIFAEFGNTSLAEGLLHDLQGWVVFMISAALLLGETWLLTRIFSRGKDWRNIMAFEFGDDPEQSRPDSPTRQVPIALITSTVVLCIAILMSFGMPERAEASLSRSWFIDFPLEIGQWHGQHGRIEDQFVDQLEFDDYLMADYTNGSQFINLYSAFYASQRSGASIHSPRGCIPGGGWRITEIGQVPVPLEEGSADFRVNRALIELGNQRQLVYYWFKQRERNVTNEYLAKWFIFVDALTRNRTDGALVRLTTPLPPGEPIESADARLREFAAEVHLGLTEFVPD